MQDAKTSKEQTLETIQEDMLNLPDYLKLAIEFCERCRIFAVSQGLFCSGANYVDLQYGVKTEPVKDLLIKNLKKHLSKMLRYSVTDTGATIFFNWK